MGAGSLQRVLSKQDVSQLLQNRFFIAALVLAAAFRLVSQYVDLEIPMLGSPEIVPVGNVRLCHRESLSERIFTLVTLDAQVAESQMRQRRAPVADRHPRRHESRS